MIRSIVSLLFVVCFHTMSSPLYNKQCTCSVNGNNGVFGVAYSKSFKCVMCVLQVLCVGPTGSGKTLTTSDKLLKGMDNQYLSHFITFSARTSANQSQDIIDGKLDKR